MGNALWSTLFKQQPHSNFTNMASANVSSFKKPNNNPQKRTHIQSSRINNFLQNLGGFLKAKLFENRKCKKLVFGSKFPKGIVSKYSSAKTIYYLWAFDSKKYLKEMIRGNTLHK